MPKDPSVGDAAAGRQVTGHDLDAALAFVRGVHETSAALAILSDDEAARTVERLRTTLAAHYSNQVAWSSIRAPG